MYKQLDIFERQCIEIHLKRWCTYVEIWLVLWRNPWTISREVARNSVRKKWTKKRIYLAIEAEFKSYQRRRWAKSQSKKINMNSEMKRFIIEQLARTDMNMSPKSIAKAWNKTQKDKKKHITHSSIYTWLETGMWNKYKELLLYKYKWYRKKKLQTDKVKIKDRVWIEQRPEIINNREEVWHLEADLIVSKKWFKWAVLTLIDRKTRLPRIFKLKDKTSQNIMKLIESVKDEIWIKSVTFDNWMEFAKHYLLHDVWIDTYFCDPYASYQKWSIENLNRIIRRWFPKGTVFDNVAEEKIRSICDILANTPREILGFLSPNQVHFQ